MLGCSASIVLHVIPQRTGSRYITARIRALQMKVEEVSIMAAPRVEIAIRRLYILTPVLPAMTVIIQMEREGAMVVETMISH